MLIAFQHKRVGYNGELCRERNNYGVAVFINLIVAGTLVIDLYGTGFFVSHIHKREGQSIFTHFEVPLSDCSAFGLLSLV